jgi:Zn finger protein HypA/HybF involved in hydrogenase expression
MTTTPNNTLLIKNCNLDDFRLHVKESNNCSDLFKKLGMIKIRGKSKSGFSQHYYKLLEKKFEEAKLSYEDFRKKKLINTGKTSLIRNYNPEILKKYVDESQNYSEIFRKMGVVKDTNRGFSIYYYKILKEKLNTLNISNDKFGLGWDKGMKIPTRIYNTKFSMDTILIENSPYKGNSSIKKRIINDKLIEYKCRDCDNTGEWGGKKLVLQLEHINGINNDHRLENLTFLCPNCHSITDTFCKSHKSRNNKN